MGENIRTGVQRIIPGVRQKKLAAVAACGEQHEEPDLVPNRPTYPRMLESG